VDVVPADVSLKDFAARLRSATPPVVGYVSGGRFKLDLRTVFPRDDERLVRCVHQALSTPQP
jgi:L-seryl-tRNA(Ser) seleniumtransferase